MHFLLHNKMYADAIEINLSLLSYTIEHFFIKKMNFLPWWTFCLDEFENVSLWILDITFHAIKKFWSTWDIRIWIKKVDLKWSMISARTDFIRHWTWLPRMWIKIWLLSRGYIYNFTFKWIKTHLVRWSIKITAVLKNHCFFQFEHFNT